MTDDARFEDGREVPLYLGAFDADDLQVISGLAQDSVFPISEMTWRAGERRFALLLNVSGGRSGPRAACPRAGEVAAGDRQRAAGASQGIDRDDADTVLSLLSVGFEPSGDGAGDVMLTLAGDGAIRLEIEALEVTLKDVTRPYLAASGKVPHHDT